jgi:hypothetical protein
MKKILSICTFLLFLSCSQNNTVTYNFDTLFEKSEGKETDTYFNVISFYKNLAQTYPEIEIKEMGLTDSNYPLHVVLFNAAKEFDFEKIKTSNKSVILINNGIHPGEPDGIDASMMLLRDIVQNNNLLEKFDNAIIAVIPVYNIGGALNRSGFSRANQNGPKEYGFRGNARNFDLNRDFVKADTKNAMAFAEIFHALNPDVFIDNHVSNGANYQYAITHLFTQHNKLGNDLGLFIENEMRAAIENNLAQKNIPITPYVNVWGNTPEVGFSQYFDSPRYSTGYTTLFNTLGLMVETHMLKPYKIRVEQTYALMESTVEFSIKNNKKIKELRANAINQILDKKTYPIGFENDKTNFASLNFKGYEASYLDSEVTNGKRLFYDESKPFEKPVKYYNQYTETKHITIPNAYILKQGWWNVVDRLNANNIIYTVLKKDTTIVVHEQHIGSFETSNRPYEGHYLHYNTQVIEKEKSITFKAGDILIPTKQYGARYLFETLEASAVDSFFNWNFFDTILQQKEGYSAYVFEDIAATYLNQNKDLKDSLAKKMELDEQFAKNPRAQLDFVYKNSPYYESAHLKLPIYKVFN